jgi:hypothetical protein
VSKYWGLDRRPWCPGMNSGVFASSCRVRKARRALGASSVAVASSLYFSRLVGISRPISGGKGQKCKGTKRGHNKSVLEYRVRSICDGEGGGLVMARPCLPSWFPFRPSSLPPPYAQYSKLHTRT